LKFTVDLYSPLDLFIDLLSCHEERPNVFILSEKMSSLCWKPNGKREGQQEGFGANIAWFEQALTYIWIS